MFLLLSHWPRVIVEVVLIVFPNIYFTMNWMAQNTLDMYYLKLSTKALITRDNSDQDLCCHKVPLGRDELTHCGIVTQE